jgi:MoxR-like ATPase
MSNPLTPEILYPTFNLDLVENPGHRERLEEMIPEPAWADIYVHRNVAGWLDFDLFDYAMLNKENIKLVGPTGASKTTAFKAYAAYRRLPFTVVECNEAMDPNVIFGSQRMIEDRFEFIFGNFALVVKYGGVALIDEANLAHARITAAFHQLLSGHRTLSVPELGISIYAGSGDNPKNKQHYQPCLFAIALNSRYRGTMVLNQAFDNRHAMPFDWDYERSVEEDLCDSASLLDAAYQLRALPEIQTPVSTNALMEFEKHFHKLDWDAAHYFFVHRFPPEDRNSVVMAIDALRDRITEELTNA